jgi:hypothetical protein
VQQRCLDRRRKNTAAPDLINAAQFKIGNFEVHLHTACHDTSAKYLV